MKDRRAFGLVLLVVAAALAAGPSLRLQAASPCGAAPAMACCSGMETEGGAGAPPCGCALKAVTPSPAVVEAPAPPLVLAEAPADEVPAPDFEFLLSSAPVPPRARTGPLFLLFSSLLN